jgi:hypothetical protein
MTDIEKDRQKHWLADRLGFDVAQNVGTSPRDRLQWLIGFATHANYKALDQAAVPEEIALEVAAFIVFQGGPGATNFTSLPPLPSGRLELLAKEVRDGLERFADGQVWEIGVGGRLVRHVERLVREFPPEKGKLEIRTGWRGRASDTRTFFLLFLLLAQELLATEGETLARCLLDDCQSLFIKIDPRQKFCCDLHANHDRVRRYRATKEKP